MADALDDLIERVASGDHRTRDEDLEDLELTVSAHIERTAALSAAVSRALRATKSDEVRHRLEEYQQLLSASRDRAQDAEKNLRRLASSGRRLDDVEDRLLEATERTTDRDAAK